MTIAYKRDFNSIKSDSNHNYHVFLKKERILSTKSEVKEIVNRLWKTKAKGAFLARKKMQVISARTWKKVGKGEGCGGGE